MNKHIVENRKSSTSTLRASLLAGSLAALLVAPAMGCRGQQQQQPRTVKVTPAPERAQEQRVERDLEREERMLEERERMLEEQAGMAGPFSEEQVKNFAEAHPEVIELQSRYLQLIQESESPEEAQVLQDQAMIELNEVVQRHGLTLDQFTEIAEAAATDPEVMEQVKKEMGG